MKKIYFKAIVVLLIVITYVACNTKILDVPYALPSEATSFKIEGDFQAATIGVYAVVTDFYSSSSITGGGSYNGEARLLPSDDLTLGDGRALETFSGLNPGNSKISQNYASAYIMSTRANTLLQKLSIAPDNIFASVAAKNTYKGEALFLRAWAHYMLWNLFGTAPLDTVRALSNDQLLPKSTTGNQLLDQAISDLQVAATLLPASWNAAYLGRVTSNSAKALLGKCLVFRGTVAKSTADFQAAVTAFSGISGVSLVPNFGDNFDYHTENNSESLFEFQAGVAPVNQNAWLANSFGNLGASGSFLGMFDPNRGTATGFVGNQLYRPTAKLKAAFDVGDPRIPFTFTDNASGGVINKYVLPGQNIYDGAVLSLNNWRIIRYADVLLLQAEAVLQSGGSTATAIGYINQVRARARNMVAGGTIPADFNTGETNKTMIMQWIMDERLRELGGEGERWFDVRRWRIGGVIPTLDNAFFSSTAPTLMAWDDHYLYFPIPSGETSKNSNVIQNPGY
ncbi:MAG: RagB/SusD family nutrient uptake outer membrane protein [Bacteroidota bacterium]